MKHPAGYLKLLMIMLIAAGWLGLAGCGGSSASGSLGGSSSSSTAPMMVTVGDAPLSNILSARVTISALSLSAGSGATPVSLLQQPRTIELSGLGAVQEPLELENVPLGNYSSVSLTVSAAQATYLNSSGQPVTTQATLSQPSVTVALSPALDITASHGVQLRLDFSLAQSFDLTNNVLTFTPAINSAAGSVQSENQSEKEVEVTGPVQAVSANSISVQSADSGQQFVFAINNSTQFAGTLTLAAIQTGAIVHIQGQVQSDGSLLATMISASLDGQAEDSSQAGGNGIITAVTADSSGAVTSFTLVPREDFGDAGNLPPAGQGMTVNLNSSTIYGLASDAPQAGISASAFTNAELFAGQSVQVIGVATSAGVITAQEVDLKAESVTGTLAAVPQGTAPDFNFILQLTSSSYLTAYQKLAALNVSTNAQTEYGNNLSGSTFASTAAGTSLDVHGYLLMDAQGNFQLYASNVSQTETPEPPENDN